MFLGMGTSSYLDTVEFSVTSGLWGLVLLAALLFCKSFSVVGVSLATVSMAVWYLLCVFSADFSVIWVVVCIEGCPVHLPG